MPVSAAGSGKANPEISGLVVLDWLFVLSKKPMATAAIQTATVSIFGIREFFIMPGVFLIDICFLKVNAGDDTRQAIKFRIP